MDERRLNLNAPLMSVRRSSMASGSSAEKKSENFQFSRRHTLPVTKSHLNMDQVTEPVAVPFHWEQIPGRAKNDSASASPVRTSSTPRLSFGRNLEASGRNGCEANSFNATAERLEVTQAFTSDTKSLASEHDEDDAYSDALETLSPTDSYSVNNCTVSGISGYHGSTVKPSGTFRTDPQTRDFMMSRFLPAAKAMVLEPSKYALKKQLVAVEQPRHVKKVTRDNRVPPIKLIESTMLLEYGNDEVDEESDNVDDEYDDSGNISARGCGLIPNLCFKNSLCLLNTVPGMRMKTDSPMSFANKVGGLGRMAYSQSHSQKIKKLDGNAANTQRPDSAIGSPKLEDVKDKWISESKHSFSSIDLQMRGRSSPFRQSRAASPFRDEAAESPRRRQLTAVPKEVEIISKSKFSAEKGYSTAVDDTPSVRMINQEFDPASALVEKTLYVDTESVAETSSLLNSSRLDSEETGECGFEGTSKYSFQELKCLTLVEEGQLEREAAESKSRGVATDVGTAEETEPCNANYQIVKVEYPASVKITSVISSQPPALPKSPSESWLWRTLPSVSLRKIRNQGNTLAERKQSHGNTKWETIVKTSNLHRDRVRYSEELITHVPQHSKTESLK